MRARRLALVLVTVVLAGYTTGNAAPAAKIADPPPAPATAAPTPSASPSPESPTPTPRPTLDLTVMTFNVLGSDPPRSWFPLSNPRELRGVARVPAALELIRSAKPDILGLQEFRPGKRSGSALAAGLDEYSWAGPGTAATTSPREQVAVPLLYRTERFDLVASGARRVSRRGSGGAYLDRYVVWAELQDKATGQRVFAFNYHAHPRQTRRYAAVRAAAVDSLIAVIREVNPGLAVPFVVTGDFNARSNETRGTFNHHLTSFAGIGVVDAAAIAEADTSDIPGADSHNRMSAPVAGRDVANVVRRNHRHIDYIWVPIGTRVENWATISGPDVEWRTVRGQLVPVWSGVPASDHSPVVATVSFPRDA